MGATLIIAHGGVRFHVPSNKVITSSICSCASSSSSATVSRRANLDGGMRESGKRIEPKRARGDVSNEGSDSDVGMPVLQSR